MPKLTLASPKTVEAPLVAAVVQPGAATLVQQQTATVTAAPNPLGVVVGVVSSFVQTLLNPLGANNIPGTPVGTPLLWSVFAFARREFESIFAPQASLDAPAAAQATSQTLDAQERTLVLTALPVEADALLARTTLDPNPTVVVDGHHFYLGTLGGKPVVIAMTGIGEVNAAQTTEIALDDFTPATGITIDAVVFDGVAGGSGRTEIGDVAVPARWTLDGGTTWDPVDAGMLAAASAVTVDLDSTDTIVDPACRLCGPLAFLPLVNLGREPQVFVGGDGSTSDNNNGVAFPEIPLGGSLFGPEPLAAPDFSPFFTGNFFQAVVPFLLQGVISNIIGFLTAANPPVDAVDQETAAAQQVADAHGVPFLGIRGMSDGPGDPYPLPGYPFTFLVFNQIASDNAAIVTQAFLQNWAGA
ncbi:MAG TPA: 5'-methylthioadenosine/S-adenosylhomocysteine nucleosidase [Mycobacterium sp.]|nr:5'-methylthioadenosine/S-adenosylhomocysteine nucleosidase [Mycobacterium sp.]